MHYEHTCTNALLACSKLEHTFKYTIKRKYKIFSSPIIRGKSGRSLTEKWNQPSVVVLQQSIFAIHLFYACGLES